MNTARRFKDENISPNQILKQKAIERVIYNLCVADELQSPTPNIPAFIRAQNGITIIRCMGLVDFYFKNRNKICQFCKRYKI